MTIGADICEYIEAPLRLNYPCHSQTVEHAVQITSSVALLSTNYESRLGAAYRTCLQKAEIIMTSLIILVLYLYFIA